MTFSTSSCSIRSLSAIIFSCRISMDWIIRGASFICWLIFIFWEMFRCMISTEDREKSKF